MTILHSTAEAEHRDILEKALSGTKRAPLSEILMRIPAVGKDSDCERIDS